MKKRECLLPAMTAVSIVAILVSSALPIGAEEAAIALQLANPPATAASAATTTDFTVAPSVTSSTLGAGVNTLDVTIVCFNPLTGALIVNCDFVIGATAMANTGGHDHDDPTRPAGSFAPATGNTGPTGIQPVTYTAPEVSGIIEVALSGTAPDGTPVASGTATIGVRISGLVQLPAGANYDLVGSFGQPGVTSQHVGNHFGTLPFTVKLIGLANKYAAAFPGEKLRYNDMSLVEGGLFDINNDWMPPHKSHRFGVDIDVGLEPAANRNRLRQLIIASGISTRLVEGNHWHLRQ